MPSSTAGTLGRPRRIALLLAAAALVLTACSSAATAAPRAPNAPNFDTLSGAGKESVTTAAPPVGAGGVTQGGTPTAFNDTAKIVWTGTMQLQVKDLDAALSGAQTAITGLGGYISASRRTGSDDPVAQVTYRIPSDRWEDAMTALRKQSIKVIDEQTTSADVAAQLIDNDARLKNLRASETALQAIAAGATKVTDLLEVQARLTDIRGQIESLAAQQAALQDKVSYGTMTVTFGLQVVAVTQASKQWDPATEVDAATARLLAIGQALASAAIWFVIVWLPNLLVLGVVVFVVIRLGRRLGVRLPGGPGVAATGWTTAGGRPAGDAAGGGRPAGTAAGGAPGGDGTMGG